MLIYLHKEEIELFRRREEIERIKFNETQIWNDETNTIFRVHFF